MDRQNEATQSEYIQISLDWLVSDYQDRLKARVQGEPFTFKLKIFDIYQNKYDDELENLFDRYPKLRLVFNMRKGEFPTVANQCEFLVKEENTDPNMKPLLESIKTLNKLEKANE